MKITEVIGEPQQLQLPLEGGHSRITSKHISGWRNQMCALAQKVYNDWDQSDEEYGDPELGMGGICDLIAEQICSVLAQYGVECLSSNASVGENHTSVIANLVDGVFDIDIAPHVYETGGGYTWHKIPNVIFRPNDVSVYQIAQPMTDENFSQHYGNQ